MDSGQWVVDSEQWTVRNRNRLLLSLIIISFHHLAYSLWPSAFVYFYTKLAIQGRWDTGAVP